MSGMTNDQPKTFPKKYFNKLKEFAPEYADTVEGANSEEVKRMMLSAEQHIFETEHAMENNDALLDLKERLKTEMAPFKEVMQTEMAKIKYCLYKLDERNVKI